MWRPPYRVLVDGEVELTASSSTVRWVAPVMHSGPLHPTCIEVSTIGQGRGAAYVCGPECPPESEANEVWETCAKCKGEFVAGHLCRTHRLCGICHWPL